MSVEENKEAHRKVHEEIWIKRNIDLVDEVFGDEFRGDMGRGDKLSAEQSKAMLKKHWASMDENNRKITGTDYHAKIGEGDHLADWQTNHFSDGSSTEEVNLFVFKDGKNIGMKSFKLPEKK